MPPINHNYDEFARPGKAGHKATMEAADVISRLNEDDDMTGFGVAVFQGARDKGVTKTAGDFVGITVHDGMAYTDLELTEEGFAPGVMMSVMRKGPLWVNTTVAVAAGDPVTAVAGGFSNTGGVAVPDSRFETSTSAAGLAQIKFG